MLLRQLKFLGEKKKKTTLACSNSIGTEKMPLFSLENRKLLAFFMAKHHPSGIFLIETARERG